MSGQPTHVFFIRAHRAVREQQEFCRSKRFFSLTWSATHKMAPWRRGELLIDLARRHGNTSDKTEKPKPPRPGRPQWRHQELKIHRCQGRGSANVLINNTLKLVSTGNQLDGGVLIQRTPSSLTLLTLYILPRSCKGPPHPSQQPTKINSHLMWKMSRTRPALLSVCRMPKHFLPTQSRHNCNTPLSKDGKCDGST